MGSSFRYAGALVPTIPGHSFGTSIFKDENGDAFVQEEKDDVITSFTPVQLTRALVEPDKKEIFATPGDPYIFSYLEYLGNEDNPEVEPNMNRLHYGRRAEIELHLLPILDKKSITVHSRLLISTFLRLYQRTIQLVEETNKDLDAKGIRDRIDPVLLVTQAAPETNEPGITVSSILTRFHQFHNINLGIRIEDIVWLHGKSAYFTRRAFQLEKILNKASLRQTEHRKAMSQLVERCVRNDRRLLARILHSVTECYDFIVQSEFLVVAQCEIEALLSEKVDSDETRESDTSILDKSIEIDKQLYQEPNPGVLIVPLPHRIDAVLQQSVLTIIQQNQPVA